MIFLKRSCCAVTLAASSVFVSTAAMAGGSTIGPIIFDPTNFIENIQKAMSTVEIESQGIEEAIRQAQMLEDSIKNTASTVSNLSGIGSIGSDIASLQQQWKVDQTLMSELGGQSNFVGTVMSQFSASSSNGSFTDYVTALAGAAQQGQQNATSMFANYQHMSAELQKTINQRQAIAVQNSGVLGTTDAIQVTNAQLDNLAEINQATLQGITTLVRQKSYQQAAESGKDQAAAISLGSYYSAKQREAEAATNSAPNTNVIMGY